MRKKLIKMTGIIIIASMWVVTIPQLAEATDTNIKEHVLADEGAKIGESTLAHLIYSVVFTNLAGNTLMNEPVEELPYEKEFNDAVAWFNNQEKEEWASYYESDGIKKKLRALYLKNPNNTKKTMILAHGVGGSTNMGPWAKLFYDNGYNVLLPQSRSYGESEGDADKNISLGWLEREDYINWIHLADKENGLGSEIALMGASMGSTAVLLASGQDLPKSVKAIIADCGFASHKALIQTVLQKLPFGGIINKEKTYRLINQELFEKQNFKLEDASTTREVAKSKIPTLIIHGTGDQLFPVAMAQDIYQALGGEKELYLVEGGPHFKSIAKDLPNYTAHVNNFVNKFIK
ncbi:alpha/beta fold hydrolase [Listeria rocourtiae]|uniref:alpha/beta hydrolase n=1 Tax=Listeria rocourtiae TaxID=647910 RepID=UPI003D2F5ADF